MQRSPDPLAATPDDTLAIPCAHLGRQPIVDKRLRTVGYELLYRNGVTAQAEFDDPAQATSTVLANLLLEFGVDRVVGRVPAWVNFPGRYLLQEMPIPIPPEKLVVEVLEDVEPTEDMLRVLRRLADQGYQLALQELRRLNKVYVPLSFCPHVQTTHLRQATPRVAAPQFRQYQIAVPWSQKPQNAQYASALQSIGPRSRARTILAAR